MVRIIFLPHIINTYENVWFRIWIGDLCIRKIWQNMLQIDNLFLKKPLISQSLQVIFQIKSFWSAPLYINPWPNRHNIVPSIESTNFWVLWTLVLTNQKLLIKQKNYSNKAAIMNKLFVVIRFWKDGFTLAKIRLQY